MLQSTALNILKSGKNVFLTGSAGTGKTFLLNQYIQYLRERNVKVAVTASTGIAATHLGGKTIHSWSGIGIKDSITEHDLEKMRKKQPLRNRLEDVQVLVIDEISMLSGKTLSCIDQILKFFKVSFAPFGGVQVILSGDFFQLPPVSRERLSSAQKFAFMHPIWVQSDFNICYLTENFRQEEDSDLVNILNEMRAGEISDSTSDMLLENMEVSQMSDKSAIKLYTHNADVERINYEKLDQLQTEHQIYEASTEGSKTLVDSMKKSILVPDQLLLKKHAQVMFIKNNYERGYLNGTMGTITHFNQENLPVVETFDGNIITVKKEDWAIENELGQPVARFSQLPLRLAWAITIHKSQGMTLDCAEIDLSKTFEPGQGYVALSRVKSLDGLKLLGCNQNALVMDELAMKADIRFQELARLHENEILKTQKDTWQEIFDNFILATGGIIDEFKIQENIKKLKEAKTKALKKRVKKVKGATFLETKKLIEEGLSLDEIAQKRELTKNTIVGHLEKLLKNFPDIDAERFRPDETLISDISKVIKVLEEKSISEDYDQDKNLKLGLIHRELQGKYDYDEIRLGRIFV